LQRKGANEMKQAMTLWINSLNDKPEKLQTDRGLEFRARAVQQALHSAGIVWEPVNGTMKAAVAERANKTLQILIYKHLSAKGDFEIH
jgi:3-oxoacyl-(acyl-carrier-protein) synthase